MSSVPFYAHTSQSADETTWQLLVDHLEGVAAMAAHFAEPFCGSEWAYAAGLLHDLGKGCDEFQRRLHGKHPAIDHSIAGASFAETYDPYSSLAGMKEGPFISSLIAGHHIGLQDYAGEHSLQVRLEQYERGDTPAAATIQEIGCHLHGADDTLQNKLAHLCLQHKEVQSELLSFSAFTLAHLLFSSLVDADWLDTERFMSPNEYEERQAAQSMQEELQVLSNRLDAHLSAFAQNGPINAARGQLLEEVRRASSLPAGIFELNMPTGSGKTLASMSFALRHAMVNGQRRIIYAIPFMSIVEQNAQVFKDVLGKNNVIEHVSSYDFGLDSTCLSDLSEQNDASRRRGLQERMLTENWHAPIVVTTNVQLFESLFSNKVSKSRKVHNIANSVIVLDEAQALPDGLLLPTLAMLESLTLIANVTVVLCTATQPSLDELWPLHTKPTRIVEDVGRFDSVFGNRVHYDCSHVSENEAYDLDELLEELSACPQVLCVVSSRRAARAVYDGLLKRNVEGEGLFHLSAYMVPEHRTMVLDEIRGRLKTGLACKVISTQLVEAGVDVDFPVVFREIAGIDSMLQAAGRCNREGRLDKPGRVVIFECTEFAEYRSSKPNWLGKMRALGLEILNQSADDGTEPFGTISVDRFFKRRHQTGSLDGTSGKPVFGLITKHESLREHAILGHYPYETIAQRYRFFTEETVSVFVPWGRGKELLDLMEEGMFSDDFRSRLQRYTVSVPRYAFAEYEKAKAIRYLEHSPIPVLETRDGMTCHYDDMRGLLSPGEEELDVLVI